MSITRAGIVLATIAAGALVTACERGDAAGATTGAAFAVESLGSPAAPGSAEPSLAVSGERVYLSWLEPLDSGHALRIATLEGAQWSTPRTIRAGRDFFVNWADFPSVLPLGDGRLAAHWLQRNGKGTYAYGVRVAHSSDDGATWSEGVAPHRDDSPTEHGFVAMWPEGDRLNAVWLDGRNTASQGHGHGGGGAMMLLTTSISARGSLGAETRLDERVCDCCQTDAAMTADGPVIAYRDRSAEEIRDIYVTRRVDGKWIPGAPVHADNWKINACPVNGPAIAARGRQVALAWFTAANDSARVKVAFSDDAGTRFAPPVRVDDGTPAGRVDVVLLADGAALVAWIERLGGDTAAVRVRRIGRDGTVGATRTVARSSAARASGFPRMAIAGDDVIFAWTEPGKPSHVRVARAALRGI